MSARLDHGTVVAWKGTYGFLRRDGDNFDIFIHGRDLLGTCTLCPGRRVVFEIIAKDKQNGLKAIRCRYDDDPGNQRGNDDD